MRTLPLLLVSAVAALAASGLVPAGSPERPGASPTPSSVGKAEPRPGERNWKVTKTDAEWKQILTPEQYHILREKGTEGAFTGEYNKTKEKGTYVCAACGNPLFSSETKYDSGTGWPSFWAPLSEWSVRTEADRSLLMTRSEVLCKRCDGHLGHVFDDGPKPTGERYCMNSAALKLVPQK